MPIFRAFGREWSRAANPDVCVVWSRELGRKYWYSLPDGSIVSAPDESTALRGWLDAHQGDTGMPSWFRTLGLLTQERVKELRLKTEEEYEQWSRTKGPDSPGAEERRAEIERLSEGWGSEAAQEATRRAAQKALRKLRELPRKPFLTLNLTETEARALLHAAEVGLTASGKGDDLHGKRSFVRLGSTFLPHGGGAETSAAVRESYTYEALGESDEYKEWVRQTCEGEAGPESYDWAVGIPP